MNPRFMREAIRLSHAGIRRGEGGPFGAVVVRRGKIVGRGHNRVTSAHDPTAHAEVEAIRAAGRKLGTFLLDDCELYTSCEPCPMCLAAIYWARIGRVYYANTRRDAAAAGFDDAHFYRELAKPICRRQVAMKRVPGTTAKAAFAEWMAKTDRVRY